jgi:hypothetical protein
MNLSHEVGGGLDSILQRTPIPYEFSILSIDIDSYDLEVWEGLTSYSPLIVVIEINSSLAPGILHRHTDAIPGNSFTSTILVAKHKGYTLVCHTGNLIFVRSDKVQKLQLQESILAAPEKLFLPSWLPRNGKNMFKGVVKRLLGKS